jgi:hypothetical protein
MNFKNYSKIIELFENNLYKEHCVHLYTVYTICTNAREREIESPFPLSLSLRTHVCACVCTRVLYVHEYYFLTYSTFVHETKIYCY